MVTWIVGIIVFAVAGSIIWKMIKERRQGKSTCSGNCHNCHMNCHMQ